jgi:hypothetical protein
LRRPGAGHHPAVGDRAISDVAEIAALQMELQRAVEARTLERWAGYRSGRKPARDDKGVRPPRRRSRSRSR